MKFQGKMGKVYHNQSDWAQTLGAVTITSAAVVARAFARCLRASSSSETLYLEVMFLFSITFYNRLRGFTRTLSQALFWFVESTVHTSVGDIFNRTKIATGNEHIIIIIIITSLKLSDEQHMILRIRRNIFFMILFSIILVRPFAFSVFLVRAAYVQTVQESFQLIFGDDHWTTE